MMAIYYLNEYHIFLVKLLYSIIRRAFQKITVEGKFLIVRLKVNVECIFVLRFRHRLLKSVAIPVRK